MRPYENPFRVSQLEALTFRPQGTDWATLEENLIKLRYRAAIVGPEGSGKTTLLRQLGERLREQGKRTRWLQLTRDRRTFTPTMARELTAELGADDIILFDGGGHLPPWRWWAFQRRARGAGGLIITAHFGRRLPILLRTQTDVQLLDQLVRELLRRHGIDDASVDVAALHRKHRGNVRAALLELYDRYTSR